MKQRLPLLLFGLALLGLNLWGILTGLNIWREHLSGAFPEPVLVEGPNAELPLSSYASLRWVWDQPVVADAEIGLTLTHAPAEIDPSMQGVYSWVNDRTLEFKPAEAWPPARRIRVEVDTVLTNRQHRVFAVNHSATLIGPRLAIRKVEPTVQWDSRELQVRIQLNQEVNPDKLRQHVLLMDDQMTTVPSQVQTTPQPDEFLLTAPWRTREGMTLVIKEGLSSVYGDFGHLDRERVYKIHPPEHFRYMGMELEQPTFGEGSIELAFSSPPDFQSVSDFLQIEPAIPFSVDKGKWWRRNQCTLRADFEPGVDYTLHFTKGIESINGEPLDEAFTKSVVFPKRNPGLKFMHEGWVLNAAGAQQIQVDTRNEEGLSLQMDRVHANNLVAYAVRASGKDGWNSKQDPDRTLSSEGVWKQEMQVSESGPVSVDLSQPLDECGQGVYRLTVKGEKSGRTVERLIVVSDVGLLLRQHGDDFLVWAVQLDSAEPVADLPLTLWSDTRQKLGEGVTDAQGLVRMTLSADATLGRPFVILASSENRVGMLTLDRTTSFPGEGGARAYLREGHEGFVYTERGIYRPGETVNARAILRGAGFSLPGEFPLQWSLRSAKGIEVWSSVETLSDVGTSSVTIPLDTGWASGSYRLLVSLPGKDAEIWGGTSFKIESFVPPQVVVEADSPEGEVSVPGTFRVKVHARMLYGGPAANHKGSAVMTLTPEDFRASEHPGYSFSDRRKQPFGAWSKKIHSFTTNPDGEETLPITIPEDKQGPSAVRAVIGISVNEFSGRAATTFVSRRVDRVPYYVGIKEAGQNEDAVNLSLVGVAPSGALIAESPELELSWYRLTWQNGYRRNSNGNFSYYSEEVSVLEGSRSVVLHEGQIEVPLALPSQGVYRIAVEDKQAGTSSTARVYRGGATDAPTRADTVKLSLDKETYVSGEEAELTLTAPFAGRVLLSIEDAGLLFTDVVELTDAKGTYRFTVPASTSPNLWVRAFVLRPQPDQGATPVMRSEGAVALRMDTAGMQKALALEVADQLIPSQDAVITVTGEPGAEVVVAGVDEGILLLTDFKTPDPVSWFRVLRLVMSKSWNGFDDLLPELGVNRFAGDAAMGGGGASLRQRLNPVDAKRFRPLSWWSGAQRIPASGVLTLRMPMPEFSGEVRWMAVQVSENSLGHAEASSKVGRPVVVQQSLPLFLAPGDVSDWTVRLHNRGTAVQDIRLIPQVNGPLLSDDGELVLQLKPGEVRVHRMRVTASNDIGTAEAVLTVSAGETDWEDRIELAVRPVEAFQVTSKTRILGPGEQMKLSPVTGYLDRTVLRSVQVASMPSLQLGGAIDYLLRYPYGCLEQTVSSATPALVLPDWSKETASGAEVVVNAAVNALWKKQRSDGSFGYWNRSDATSVEGSLGALEFLLEAKAKGYVVHEASLKAGVRWAESWLSGITDTKSQLRNIAHACKVLAMAGELDKGWVQRLRERREDLDASGRIQAAEAMMLSGYRPLALEMLHGLSKVKRPGWGWYSQTSENAHLLRVLLELEPQDGRVLPLVEAVLEARNSRGRWAHSYENAAVLRAMVAYAKRYGGEEEPIQATWNSELDGERSLQDGKDLALTVDTQGVVTNNGTRPVYVEERMEGVPLVVPKIENAFTIRRSVLRMTGEEVTESQVLKSGEPYLLHLRVSGLPDSKEYLVLDQRLPAGLEALGASVQAEVGKRLQFKPNYGLSAPRHLEVRDDRVLIFPHTVHRMQTDFLIAVRAVSPGDFRFPAVFGQDMYDDDFVARGLETRIQVAP